MVIKEGTAAYNAWIETPIPVYSKYYFFDPINPSELVHHKEKAILEERGPYTFRYTVTEIILTYDITDQSLFPNKNFTKKYSNRAC